jgi:hypothetical protein
MRISLGVLVRMLSKVSAIEKPEFVDCRAVDKPGD